MKQIIGSFILLGLLRLISVQLIKVVKLYILDVLYIIRIIAFTMNLIYPQEAVIEEKDQITKVNILRLIYKIIKASLQNKTSTEEKIHWKTLKHI